MVRGARENFREYLPSGDREGDWHVARADATALPLPDDAVDGVAFDAPYGRQSKIARHELADLVAGALAEAARVAPRAVIVADRDWRGPAREAGWTVDAAFERRVHRSLTRGRTRRGRRRPRPRSRRTESERPIGGIALIGRSRDKFQFRFAAGQRLSARPLVVLA
jgi:hypothetical protein